MLNTLIASDVLAAAGLILAVAFFNRVSGGGFYGDKIPGRPLYLTAPIVGVLTAIYSSDATLSVTVALAFLLWRVGPWGRWFDLGRLPHNYARDGDSSGFEAIIETVADGSDHVAFFYRQAVGLFPGLLIISLALSDFRPVASFPIMAAFIVLIYEACWRYRPQTPIPNAEILTGALWGCMIVWWATMIPSRLPIL